MLLCDPTCRVWLIHMACFAVLQQRCSSFGLCVPFAGRFAGYATPQLRQRNACGAACIPASSTSVGTQCHHQTNTSILSVWAHHRLWSVVSKMHHLKLAVLIYWCLHGLAPQLHSACCRFQLLLSPVVVILAASDYPATYTVNNALMASIHLQNGLPCSITSVPSLTVFQKRLKTYLST